MISKFCQVCAKPVGKNSRSRLCRTHFRASEPQQERARQFRETHRKEIRGWKKDHQNRIRQLWGDGIGNGEEDYTPYEKTAMQILSKRGYDELIWASQYNAYFPFDIIAKKNGRIDFYEVTTALYRNDRKQPGRAGLAEMLNGRLFVFFISPRHRMYLIKEALPKKAMFLTLGNIRAFTRF
jgi:hypothetical protein